MVVLNALIIWEARDAIARGYGDFSAFYTAGKILRAGQGARLYDRKLQWEIQKNFAGSVRIRKGPLPYIRPPFHALLFWPLAYLSYPAASGAWISINVGILIAIPFLLDSEPGLWAGAEGSLLCLSFFPAAFDLLQGQDAVLLLLLLVLAYRSLTRNADYRCGLFLGLGLFKFHLVVPLALIFLIRKKFKITLSFAVTGLLLLAASAAITGLAALLKYPRYVWQLSKTPSIAGMKPWGMPDTRGFLIQVGPKSLAHADWVFAGVVIAGALVVAAVWRPTANMRLAAAGFSFAIVTTLVASYYANSYDLTILLLPILLLDKRYLDEIGIAGKNRIVFFTLIAVILFTPLYWISILRLDQFSWVALLLLLFAGSLIGMLKREPQALTVTSRD